MQSLEQRGRLGKFGKWPLGHNINARVTRTEMQLRLQSIANVFNRRGHSTHYAHVKERDGNMNALITSTFL